MIRLGHRASVPPYLRGGFWLHKIGLLHHTANPIPTLLQRRVGWSCLFAEEVCLPSMVCQIFILVILHVCTVPVLLGLPSLCCGCESGCRPGISRQDREADKRRAV
ncbi:hypothetical protein N656DRAFT_526988 [Canariomyces notabilis]|uniref:Uncharacterized protein n=1 Tax=Canariomyces notabilis TaxID=2074819 RepID=A0AAN6THC1_9PEZI|nr:hypothetical protein N656DRAFT_526988 [Canariomyces arenarius]